MDNEVAVYKTLRFGQTSYHPSVVYTKRSISLVVHKAIFPVLTTSPEQNT